jgi:hypothetical protein
MPFNPYNGLQPLKDVQPLRGYVLGLAAIFY